MKNRFGGWLSALRSAVSSGLSSVTSSTKMYTLVVVDMQAGFNAANRHRVRQNCLREVRRAKQDGADIIFLEFRFNEETHKELIEAAGQRYFVLEKDDDDGSSQVASKVRSKNLHKHFRVCGVNTDCCVKATVLGLTDRFPNSKIDVVADACDSDWNHNSGLSRMKQLNNVRIIK